MPNRSLTAAFLTALSFSCLTGAANAGSQSPDIERMMEEARRRQAEVAQRAQQGQSGVGIQTTPLKIDPANPPTVILGSVLVDSLSIREDGRFFLSNFKMAGLPDKDENGAPVSYAAMIGERVHVRLTAGGKVLSDHY